MKKSINKTINTMSLPYMLKCYILEQDLEEEAEK